MSVSWEALGSMVAVISSIVLIATAYLKMFVGRELATLKEWIRKEFVSRDMLDARLDAKIEGRRNSE